MHTIIAHGVDPVLIFSFLGAGIVSFVTGLVALFWRFKLAQRRALFSWISIALGVVFVVVAGEDGAIGGPEGLLFTIPLALGILSLLRCGKTTQPPTNSQ
jgi:hypothetical protein